MDIAEALDRCRKPLIDTGGRSRLINFPLKGRKTQRWLRIVGEHPDHVFHRLVIQAKHFQFDPIPGTATSSDETLLPDILFDEADVDQTDDRLQSDRTQAALDSCLETMARQARSCIDETGVNMLYAAIGMLEWYESRTSAEPRFAPLLLVPVELRKEFSEKLKRSIYRLHYSGEDIQTNLSLAKRLDADFGQQLPPFVDGDIPSKYFADIQTFTAGQQPPWQIHNEIVLAFFSFQKQLLYLDLAPDNWSDHSGRIDNAQIATIFEGVDQEDARPRYEADMAIDENPVAESTMLVVDADSSQHSALCDIAHGHDLVIEGPPGTGKSQTIINAIASAMASGKTVLFVAEKLAALKVVYQRLDDLGLADLCLNLHSDQATPRLVCEDLAMRLGQTFSSPRELDSVRRDLLHRRKQLKEYLDATAKTTGPLALPLRDVFWRLAKLRGDGSPLLRSADARPVSREQFNDSVTALKAITRHITELDSPYRCVWWGFDCPDLSSLDTSFLAQHLQSMLESARQFVDATNALDELLGFRSNWAKQLHNVSEIAIGRLQAVTGAFDTTLCCLLADPAHAEAATALVRQLAEFRDIETQAAACCVDNWRSNVNAAHVFRGVLRDVKAGRIHNDNTIRQLTEWMGRLPCICDLFNKLTGMIGQIASLGFECPANLAQFDKAINVYALITDAYITDTLAREHLFLASTERLFCQARDYRDRLNATEQSLARTFAMRDLPEQAILGDIGQVLRSHGKKWHRFLWRDYRQAMSRLKRFLSGTAQLHPTHLVNELDRLRAYLIAVDDFASEERYARVFGPIFSGMSTDWVLLEHLVRWAKTLVATGVGAPSALRLMRQCAAVADKPHVSELRATAKLLRDELGALPPHLLDAGESNLDQMSFGILSRRASDLQASITTMHSSLGGFRSDADSTVSQMRDAATQVIRAAQMEQEVNDSNRHRHALPGYFQGTRTDVAHLNAALDLVNHLRDLRLGTQALRWLFTEDSARRAQQLAQALEPWFAARKAWSTQLTELRRYGTFSPAWVGSWDSPEVPLPTERIPALLASVGQVSTWIEFCRTRRGCGEEGLGPWVDAVVNGEIAVDKLVASFDRTVHHWAAQQEVASNPRLHRFSRQRHEQIRDEFADLDRRLIQLQRDQTAWLASNRIPPAGVNTGRVGEYTQMGLISHQITLQRRHRPIRELVRRAGRALAALKPCWMMSPLAVAQFIEPGTMVFDLVIMDEASQIKPADALGSIARAKQVVVVGDDKQMPPATWMERMDDADLNGEDDEDETLADDSESILEWASKAYRRTRRLKWHYRSEHESLIAFSNEKFYDGELIVFPAPNRREGRLGLCFHHVPDGRWAARRNVPEAQQVAIAAIQHIKAASCGSLGIATFNAPQAEAIQEEIDRLLANDPEARHAMDRLNRTYEPFFIKNVENIQGDERDTILLSYTYGPDASGAVAQRFFPINTEKGWRRFNVLVTRARQRIELYTSLLPDQIASGGTRPRGVVCMHDYLAYARDGVLTELGRPSGRSPDSDFEVAVARVIQGMGYNVAAQVGVAGYFIDLAVCRPGTTDDFVLGIECDGATYHSSRSARDRDRLRQEVIERRGWKLHRIWSTDWFHNQASEEVRLQQAVANVMANCIDGLARTEG